MNRTEIKKALEAKGFNLARVAEALDVTPPAVSAVISGRHSGKRIALAVCKLINKPVGVVFPQHPQYQTAHFAREKSEEAVDEIRQILQAS